MYKTSYQLLQALFKNKSRQAAAGPLSDLDIRAMLNSPHQFSLKAIWLADQAKEQMQVASKELWKKWMAMKSYFQQMARKYHAMAKRHRHHYHRSSWMDNEVLQDSYYAKAMANIEKEFKHLWGALSEMHQQMVSYYREMLNLDKREANLTKQYDNQVLALNKNLSLALSNDFISVPHAFAQDELNYLMARPNLHPIWDLSPNVKTHLEEALPQELNLLAMMLSHPAYQAYFKQNEQILRNADFKLTPLLTHLRSHPLHATCHRRWQAHADAMERLTTSYRGILNPLMTRRSYLQRAYDDCQEDMDNLTQRLTQIQQQMQALQSDSTATVTPDDLNAQLGFAKPRRH